MSCGGNQLTKDIAVPHRPIAVPADQAPAVSAPSSNSTTSFADSQYLGNNTCRYRGLSYVDGGTFKDGGVGQADLMTAAVFSVSEGTSGQQKAHAVANARALGALPATNRAAAWAIAGVGFVQLEDWPQPSSVTVTYPWHVRGAFDVSLSFHPSEPFGTEAMARYELKPHLQKTTVGGTVQSDLWGTAFETETLVTSDDESTQRSVTKDGTYQLTLSTPTHRMYHAFIQSEAIAEANSGTGQDAFAEAEIAREDLSHAAWTSYQDWKFNLPAGWEIDSC